MRDGRLMVAGLDGSGKSTVADLVEGQTSNHAHREDCLYRDRSFEVPGRYMENHWMHNIVLMLACNQAAAALFLQDGTASESVYSAGYARALALPCLGVLTKCGGLDEAARARGLDFLAQAGCRETLCLATETGEGVPELLEWVRSHVPAAHLD